MLRHIISGGIAQSATRRYIIYSEADFELFRPTGATRCTDGGEIWHGGGDPRSPPPCHISPQSVQRLGYRSPKLKFYWDLIKMWNINAPQGRIPCAIFTTFAEFQCALAVKISLHLLKGLWSCYGGFKLMGSGYPQIFSAPSGETMRQTHKRFPGARTSSRSSITMPSLVGLGFHPPPRWPKTLSFLSVCLSVCLFVTLLNVRDCALDFAMNSLE